MSVNWSWAWGSETALVLETSAGWDFSSTSASNVGVYPTGGLPAGVPEFSYPGSPTRYTIALKSGTTARTPIGVGAPQGWLAGHFFLNSAGGFSNYEFFNIIGTSSGRRILCKAVGATAVGFYVDNTFNSASGTVPPLTWHHIAIKYDMSTTTWLGELWINGVLVSGPFTDSTSTVAEASTYFRISGLLNTSLVGGGYWAGLVSYDDMADPGSTSRHVTRVTPTADVSDSGTWVPASTGTDQTTELASPLDITTTVTDGTPASGDNVVINVNNLATQLGITPNIYGVTAHGYADGVGVSVEAAVGEGATYTTGSSVVAGTATYATATAPTKPAGGAWAATDTVLLKFEVS